MKWCRFQLGNVVSFGIVEEDAIVEVQGTPFGDYTRTATRHPISSVKLLTPCVPPTFYAAGINYVAHVEWANQYWGRSTQPPKKADIGYRANNALINPDEPIVIPKDATEAIHYENELVAVVGRQAKRLSRDEALTCLLGYTIGNDVSERTWQHEDRTLWRAKNTDTFKPMGPWIETDVDPSQSTSVTRINGEEVSRFATGNMVFDVATYLYEMTKYLTLYPGDVVWMGTDGHTIPEMKDGDVVECEITGIGVLRNPVVREE